MKSRTSRGPVLGRLICINVVIPESSELSVQSLSFTMIDNLAVFIFKESENTTFRFFNACGVLGIAIGIARVSIIDFDNSKVNRIIFSPLPVFYIWIVGLFEGYLYRLEGGLTLSLMVIRVGVWWFGI